MHRVLQGRADPVSLAYKTFSFNVLIAVWIALLPYTDYKNNILKEKAEQARTFPAKNIDLDKGNNDLLHPNWWLSEPCDGLEEGGTYSSSKLTKPQSNEEW